MGKYREDRKMKVYVPRNEVEERGRDRERKAGKENEHRNESRDRENKKLYNRGKEFDKR